MTGKLRRKKKLELFYNELEIYYVHQIPFSIEWFHIIALTFIISANIFGLVDCVSKNLPIEAMIDQASRFPHPGSFQNVSNDFVREGETKMILVKELNS